MPHPNNINNNKYKILIIRFSSIGDILLTTPLLLSIKRKYPAAFIDYLTNSDYIPLLMNNPCIDNLHSHERKSGILYTIRNAVFMRKIQYDFILDLHRSTRSVIYRLLLKSHNKNKFSKNYFKRFLLINFKLNLYNPPFSVVKRYYDTARDLLNKGNDKTEIWIKREEILTALNRINQIAKAKYKLYPAVKDKTNKIEKGIIRTVQKTITIMPFAKWQTKEWGDEKFIDLGRKIILDNSKTIVQILGSMADKTRAERIAEAIGKNAISFAGKLDIPGAALLISASECLVSNDTGIMHIGGAVSIPVIAVFGCTTEELGFFPHKTEGAVVQVKLRCRPCTSKGLRQCPRRHFNCMNLISTDMVYSVVKRYI